MKAIVALISLFLLASCQNQSAPSSKNFKAIMLKSGGLVTVSPDMASFRIELECLDASLMKSKECLAEKSKELMAKLLAFGVKKEDIQTSAVSMNKSYKWMNGNQVFEGYKTSTSVNLSVRDLNKLEALYSDLLENKNLQVNGLSYSHSKQDSLENEAYLKALENSNALSEQLLKKLPESKKEILKIGNVELSSSIQTSDDMENLRGNYNYKSLEVSENSNISISTGNIAIHATLYVEYRVW
jgi:uncharacterized protein YggE